jgi:hypothetical protein
MLVGKTYVSYWPNEPAGKKDVKIGTTHESTFARRYETDRRLEERAADQTVELRWLDEARMLEAWEKIVEDKVPYNMLSHNCSTVIATLLELGSGISPDFKPALRADEIGSPTMRFVLRLRFLGSRVAMWTPNELHRYALQIKEMRKRR